LRLAHAAPCGSARSPPPPPPFFPALPVTLFDEPRPITLFRHRPVVAHLFCGSPSFPRIILGCPLSNERPIMRDFRTTPVFGPSGEGAEVANAVCGSVLVRSAQVAAACPSRYRLDGSRPVWRDLFQILILKLLRIFNSGASVYTTASALHVLPHFFAPRRRAWRHGSGEP